MSNTKLKEAQLFVDVELGRILQSSQNRLAEICDVKDDVTLGQFMDDLSAEFDRVSSALQVAVADFRDIRIGDL